MTVMDPSVGAVETALEKVLSSAVFCHSPRLRRFLEFVVRHSTAGNDDRIKEYSIGVEVFDRGPRFEPRCDSIVRVEAFKLREKLLEYYRTEGATDAITISIPKGSYRPLLQVREAPPAALLDDPQNLCCQAESLILQSSPEFRSLAEAMPQIVWITRPDGWNVYSNQQWMDYTGLTLEESLGHGWNTPFHPDDRQRAWDAWHHATTTMSIYSSESRLRRADGVYRWWLVRGVPLHDANGKILKWFGTCTDIHDLKIAQKASQEAEERYRALFEKMLNGYAYCQMLFEGDRPQDFIYLAVNTAFERLTGLQNVVGRRVTEVIPGIKETDPELLERYGRVARSGHPERFEYWVKPLGVWFDISVYGAQEDCFVTVFDNVTERKRAEESRRLQSAALHAAADSIVVTDRAGTIEWVNPAFTQLTGYSAEEALGKHHRDLVRSGTHAKAFFKDLWETILAGRTWRGAIVNRRKDGRLYTENQSVTPIMDASGAITHFVAIQQDITERLQLEAQFRQAQKMESVGQLASGIAHDFNNLLTVINGMSELVLTQVSHDNPVHADVQEIQRAGGRAAALTRQLLAFSRQQILEPRVLNVGTVVAGLESLLRRLLGEDIDLVVVPTPDVGHVKVDPGQLEQVITNLAVNARDAMPEGGRLTVEVQNVTIDEASAHQDGEVVPTGSYVRLAVGDSGIGMDKAIRARIFEPFFTTKGPGKGTGLGLSTVFGIVKQSQGFIRVYSEVGRGTSFKIYLPQVTQGAAGTTLAAPTVTSKACTETILVVEDDAGLRKLATRVLEPAGYTVLGAATGDEALLLVERQEKPVHLLLSDVVMPGMSGRHLAEEFAQTRPGMKVLYMSGYTSDTIVRHGVLEAKVPFLGKPFTAAALLQKVREVLDS